MEANKKPKIIACIPAYNEEKYIAKVILQTKPYVDEILICNDGSTDMTEEIAKALGAIVINHPKNMGKGAAIKTLFKEALKHNPDIVVCLDADGQHDPNEIPNVIKPILKGEADFVIGSRYVKGAKTDAPTYRRIGLSLINALNKKLLRTSIQDTQSGFRAFNKKALKEMQQLESTGYGIENEQIAIAKIKNLRVMEVPVTIKYKGLEKTSKKTPVTHAGEIVSLILRLTIEEKPLLYLGLPGTTLMLIGLLLSAYLLWIFNTTRYFSIPIALITLGALFMGTMLFITALILYAITRLMKKFSHTTNRSNNYSMETTYQ